MKFQHFPGVVFILGLVIFFVPGCKNNVTKESDIGNPGEPVRVIFETDMGNDIDDALALDMLYKYSDKGKVELLAVNSNKNNEYSVRYIDILNTWYGYPEVPIGKVVNGADSEYDSKSFVQNTWEYENDGKPAFRGVLDDYSKIPEATNLYRQILAQQPDNSVVIISVGFSTNISRLLNTPADEYSRFSGKELVAKKVKLLSIMAGNFQEEPKPEYNVRMDVEAATLVFEEWPTKIVASPYELGKSIRYPATSIQNDFDWAPLHPVVVAYEDFSSMPYDRPTWDLTSVLYAIEGEDGYFTMSNPGRITVEKDGNTHFYETPGGRHQYLKTTPDQAEKVKKRLINIVTTKPKSLQ